MTQINKIGIIGYGKFGSFFAQQVLPLVFPGSRIKINSIAHCDLVIPAVPIRAMEEVLTRIAKEIEQDAVVMDVCSVKMLPVQWMKQLLPEHISIIASHPMFGPSSFGKVKGILSELKMVMHPVRISAEKYDPLKQAFSHHLQVIEMTPDAHDRKVAQFQFLSHLLGHTIHQLDIKRSPIDTEAARRMFDMMEIMSTDSFALFQDMYRFNPFAKKELQKFDRAYQSLIHLLHQ